jgi:hypothetical protein
VSAHYTDMGQGADEEAVWDEMDDAEPDFELPRGVEPVGRRGHHAMGFTIIIIIIISSSSSVHSYHHRCRILLSP